MTLVYLGVGQCGTQLLSTYFQKNLDSKNAPNFLQDDIYQFRGVLVDSETKSIDRIIRTTNLNEDRCLGLCLVHSLAGGTGSGLGVRLAEECADQFSIRILMSFSVLPHHYGDAPLQAYNSLLSLAHLNKISESLILVQNDWLMTQLRTGDRNEKKLVEVQVEQMNQLAADQMTSILAPCDWSPSAGDLPDSGTYVQPLAFGHAVTALPEAKLVRLVSVREDQVAQSTPFATGPHRRASLSEHTAWMADNCYKAIQTSLARCPIDATWNMNKLTRKTGCRPFNTLSALLIHRIQRPPESTTSARSGNPQSGLVGLKKYMRPVHWNSEPMEKWFNSKRLFPAEDDVQLTLAFNSCCITEDLNCLLYRAQMRREAGAYLHWYEKFGCTKDIFDDAFEKFRQLIQSYEELAR